MADNAPLPLATGSTRNAATDQVTYSGDVADVQLVRLVDVTGAEGSKTVVSPTFAVTGTFFQATQPVSFTWAGLTDTQLRASAVPVSLASTTVTGSVAVTGAFFQATQPVSIAGTVATSVTANGVVSTANSSVATLGIGAVFTGASEDVTEHADLRVNVFSDQVSATDGLQIQQSSNGTNWDIVDSYTIPASNGKTFSVGVSARFARVVYTNGGVAQTAFRLQTKFHKTYSKGSSVRPQDGRTNDNDYEEMLTHLMGFNGASWDRLRATIANGLAVDVTRLPALPTGTNAIGSVSSVDATASGSITAISQAVAIALNGKSGAALQITGTWVGTLQFEGTVDGTNWSTVNGVVAGTSTPGTTTSTNGIVRLTPSGLAQMRITSTAWTSGTAVISIRASDATGGTFLNQSLTAGTNHIGAVSAQAIPSAALRERLSDTLGAAVASTVFGATASQRNCITTVALYNDSATNGFVDLRDGTAGTILMTLPLPAKGGSVVNLPVPLTTSVNTALAFDVSAALTTVYLSFVGFKSAL